MFSLTKFRQKRKLINNLPEFEEILKILKKHNSFFDSVVIFGSALYSDTPNDIDILLFKNNPSLEPKDFLSLYYLMIEIEEKFEKNNLLN